MKRFIVLSPNGVAQFDSAQYAGKHAYLNGGTVFTRDQVARISACGRYLHLHATV